MSDPEWQAPPRRVGRLDRLSNVRAANAVIVFGLVLCIGGVVAAVLNTFSDKLYSDNFGAPAPTFWQRVSSFVSYATGTVSAAALVVAAGFGLRMYAQRAPTGAAPATVDLPPAEPLPETPLQLPPTHAATGMVIVVEQPDDEIWRR